MVHAEMNALCHAGRQGTKVDDSILYTTLSPCKLCLRLMWQAGIKDIYFKEKYKDFDECISMLDLKVSLNQIGDFHHMKVSTRDQAKRV
jgi:deoxycytidylate deaminase